MEKNVFPTFFLNDPLAVLASLAGSLHNFLPNTWISTLTDCLQLPSIKTLIRGKDVPNYAVPIKTDNSYII